MATPNRFLNGFPTNTTKKKSLAHSSGKRIIAKMRGPQNGDSTGDCEGQARIQFGENVAFDYLIDKYLFFYFFCILDYWWHI